MVLSDVVVVKHTGRLGGVQDGRRKGSLHGEHGGPMERVPWITASIKGLTVTGLDAEVGAGGRAANGRREEGAQQVQRGSPRLDGLDRWIEEAREAREGRVRREGLGCGCGCACLYSISAQVI